MSSIPVKVRERLIVGLKRYQPILANAKARDINESDTVTIIKDVLADVFGFDKYADVTSEYAIRGTYVDLAIKLAGALEILIEVKAIGLDLKDQYIKQAVDYAANQGVEWVVLTNGVTWQVYRVNFKQPIEHEMVVRLDLLAQNPKSDDDLENLYLLSREAINKSLLSEYHTQRQALSRYFVGAMLLNDTVLDVVRRELRRMSPNVKIDNDQIRDVMLQEVLKREVVEGERADEARRKVSRASGRALRKASVRENSVNEEPIVSTEAAVVEVVDGNS